jgi:hypothetical protein
MLSLYLHPHECGGTGHAQHLAITALSVTVSYWSAGCPSSSLTGTYPQRQGDVMKGQNTAKRA